MKRSEMALAMFVAGWLGQSALAAEETELPFDTYAGYFVSNKFEPNSPQSFVVVTDQGQFDKVLGLAMVMWDKSHRLPADAFKSKIVLVAIKRGSDVWQYKVEDVTLDEGVVQFRYTSKPKKSASASLTFACPLIVSIPQGKYTAVQFIENKKPVKRVDIERHPNPDEKDKKTEKPKKRSR